MRLIVKFNKYSKEQKKYGIYEWISDNEAVTQNKSLLGYLNLVEENDASSVTIELNLLDGAKRKIILNIPFSASELLIRKTMQTGEVLNLMNDNLEVIEQDFSHRRGVFI